MLHRFSAQAVASDPTRTFLTLPMPLTSSRTVRGSRAHDPQVPQLVCSSKRPRVQVHMPDDVVDWVLVVTIEAAAERPGVSLIEPQVRGHAGATNQREVK